MTMNEKKMQSITKEIEKLNKSLERNNARLVKKTAAAEKVNANWTREEWFANRENATPDQYEAYFDMSLVQSEIADLNRRIENANKRLAKVSGVVEADTAAAKEVERVANIENLMHKTAEEKEAEYQKWLAEFKAECLKDGIEIDRASYHMVDGKTFNGKKFFLYINSGFTVRSRHCYSLTVDGETVFTSGTFDTAYAYLMRK